MRIIETETIEEPIEEYTDEQILAICCEEVDTDPCFKAGERTEEMSALPQDSEDYPEETLALIEKAKEHHSGTKSDPLIVIRNEDRKNPCGEQETKYVRTGSCCDEVALLAIDEDSLPSAVSDWSEALIHLTAPSSLPFTVKVRGSGFYADRNRVYRDVQYSGGSSFRVYTADACGPCTITVTDGCSEASCYVRSTNGRWVEIEYISVIPLTLNPSGKEISVYGSSCMNPGYQRSVYPDTGRYQATVNFVALAATGYGQSITSVQFPIIFFCDNQYIRDVCYESYDGGGEAYLVNASSNQTKIMSEFIPVPENPWVNDPVGCSKIDECMVYCNTMVAYPTAWHVREWRC